MEEGHPMSETKEILSLIICILAVYTASALFAAGVYSSP